jgi:hypothetical protein
MGKDFTIDNYGNLLMNSIKLFMNTSHKFTLFPSDVSSKTQICTYNFTYVQAMNSYSKLT